jgi:rfaE bifunctional protein nucleotidyltransferase chain/domain
MWGAGFDYAELAEHARLTADLLAALRDEAGRYDIVLAGSLPERVEEDGNIYFHNTLYYVNANGLLGRYRKQHLFAPMAEGKYFRPGRNPKPVCLPFGFAAGLVCYDLRFPELVRAQIGAGVNLLIVSAQWPAARKEHWRTLLQARAIENQTFVAACNRCGITGDVLFAGHSMIIAPDGRIMEEAGESAVFAKVKLENKSRDDQRAQFNTAAPRPYSFDDQDKISDLAALSEEIAVQKQLGRKVVFTNGCFDLLHPGHVAYLQEARKLGDFLVVGLNSDASVRAIKGAGRPVSDQKSRARVLAALGAVDRVVLFDEETPLKLIKKIMPDVLVKGADWPIDRIVGGAEVIAAGGAVINVPTVASFSTTGIIEKVKEL